MSTVGNGYTPVSFDIADKNRFVFMYDGGFYDCITPPTLSFTPEAVKQTDRSVNNKYISYMVITEDTYPSVDKFDNTIRWMFALGRGDGKIYYNVHGSGCGTTPDYKKWDLHELEYDTLNKFPYSGKIVFGSNGYEYYGHYFTKHIRDARYNSDILLAMAKFWPKTEIQDLARSVNKSM